MKACACVEGFQTGGEHHESWCPAVTDDYGDLPELDLSLYASEEQPPSRFVLSENWLLEKLRIGFTRTISREFAETATVEVLEEGLTGDIVIAVRAFVLGEKLAEQEVEVVFERDVHFSAPSSGWQHVKADWNDWVTRKLKGHNRLWRRLHWLTVGWDVRWETRHVRETRVVSTAQFATFPAAPIKTPEKLRGPLVVRQEQSYVGGAQSWQQRNVRS